MIKAALLERSFLAITKNGQKRDELQKGETNEVKL